MRNACCCPLLKRETETEKRTSQPSASHFNAFATMNVWSPQQHDLDEILSTIFDSTNSTNQSVQRNITHVSSPFICFIHYPQMMFISLFFFPTVITETQQLYARP